MPLHGDPAFVRQVVEDVRRGLGSPLAAALLLHLSEDTAYTEGVIKAARSIDRLCGQFARLNAVIVPRGEDPATLDDATRQLDALRLALDDLDTHSVRGPVCDHCTATPDDACDKGCGCDVCRTRDSFSHTADRRVGRSARALHPPIYDPLHPRILDHRQAEVMPYWLEAILLTVIVIVGIAFWVMAALSSR